MTVKGQFLIAGQWCGDIHASPFHAVDPNTLESLPQAHAQASGENVNTAAESAASAFKQYRKVSPAKRAEFLRQIGEEILALGDELIQVCSQETALPEARLQGERGRTVNQLNMFANMLDGDPANVVIDLADPDRQPLPKPDTRLTQIPMGPVVVFGASNFPLAFSVAGGDTASALAAGCPVIFKGHPAHPGTCELVAGAIFKALEKCQLDSGVFSMIQGTNHELSYQLVQHPAVKAVGFTGSMKVGMILQDKINQREQKIPFYGELGSTNPQFILSNLLNEQGDTLAQNLVASMMMGQGQFCTSPGLWCVYGDDESLSSWFASVKRAVAEQASGPLLTPGILATYKNATAHWKEQSGVTLVGEGRSGGECHAKPMVFKTKAENYFANPDLQEEVFGPCAIVVQCNNSEQLVEFAEKMAGQLTASVHGTEEDLTNSCELIEAITYQVGRIIFNQMPTGVEVCHSMNHGGPFPASTDVRTTSVGAAAITRFQRPICYQNMPMSIAPETIR